MGHNKKAKKKENGALNIDAASVKNIFVQLTTLEGIILTSTTPQLKDLGSGNFHYTMRGLNQNGEPCVLVLNSKRNKVTPQECPVMRSVDASIVARVNAEFATRQIIALCADEGVSVTDKTARPVAIPFGTTERYGYAMCATHGENRGFVTMEAGANSVQFSEVAPKFL